MRMVVDADGERGWVAVVADGQWWCGWSRACKEKMKQNKKERKEKGLMWMRMVNADGWWWLRMSGGGHGWAVVVADGADACKEKTKQNKTKKEREERTYWWILNADGYGRGRMWTQME